MNLTLKNAFSDLYNYRHLLYQLFLRDVIIRYRQSVFGYFWAVAPQILAVLIMYMLSSRRVVSIGDTDMPYLMHALWGISVWQYFSACLLNSTNSLVKAENLIKKINFPREILVFSTIGQPLVDFAIRLVPFIFFCIIFEFMPAPASVLILPLMFFITLLALSLGLVSALFNLVIRDVSNAISLILMVGIFLSPILYPEPETFPASLVNWLNPFSPFLIASRSLMLGTGIENKLTVMITGLLVLLSFFLSWLLFRLTIQRIIERA